MNVSLLWVVHFLMLVAFISVVYVLLITMLDERNRKRKAEQTVKDHWEHITVLREKNDRAQEEIRALEDALSKQVREAQSNIVLLDEYRNSTSVEQGVITSLREENKNFRDRVTTLLNVRDDLCEAVEYALGTLITHNWHNKHDKTQEEIITKLKASLLAAKTIRLPALAPCKHEWIAEVYGNHEAEHVCIKCNKRPNMVEFRTSTKDGGQ